MLLISLIGLCGGLLLRLWVLIIIVFDIFFSMPKNKKKNPRGRRSSKGGQNRELPMASMSYSGPVMTKADKTSYDLHTVVLVQDIAAVSIGTGIMSPTFSFENPSSTQDWTNVIAIYDEYRTLAMELLFIPNMEDCLDTVNLALNHEPVYTVVDRDTNSALTSYALASNYPSMVPHSLTKRWSVTMKMKGPSLEISSSLVSGESLWLNCQAAPLLCGSIKVISVGLSASQTYGRFCVRYRVQFRGRGV